MRRVGPFSHPPLAPTLAADERQSGEGASRPLDDPRRASVVRIVADGLLACVGDEIADAISVGRCTLPGSGTADLPAAWSERRRAHPQ